MLFISLFVEPCTALYSLLAVMQPFYQKKNKKKTFAVPQDETLNVARPSQTGEPTFITQMT